MPIARRTLIATLALLPAPIAPALAASDLEEQAADALARLYRNVPRAKELGDRATAILVFPQIVKGGLLVGGLTGNGVLTRKGRPPEHYNITAMSYGLQAGAQVYSYALFFMNEAALESLRSTQGLSVGVGPSVVVIDQGFAESMTSTTVTQDVYAIPFGQQGLMAGAGLEGAKITRTD